MPGCCPSTGRASNCGTRWCVRRCIGRDDERNGERPTGLLPTRCSPRETVDRARGIGPPPRRRRTRTVVEELDAVAERPRPRRPRGGRGRLVPRRRTHVRSDKPAAAGCTWPHPRRGWVRSRPGRAALRRSRRVRRAPTRVLRAQLLTLQGQIEWNTRSLNAGYDLILQAAEAAAGVDQAMAAAADDAGRFACGLRRAVTATVRSRRPGRRAGA